MHDRPGDFGLDGHVLLDECIYHIGTDLHMLSVVVHVIGQVPGTGIPEHRLDVLPDEVADPGPFLHESTALGTVSGLHLKGEADRVVPEGIGLDLESGPFGNRTAFDVGIHPGECPTFELGPEKSVGLHHHFSPPAGQIALKDTFDHRSVLLPDHLGIGPELDILPQGACYAERSLHLGGPVEQSFLFVGDQVVQDFLECLEIASGEQGHSRESLDGLPQEAGIHPGEACIDPLVPSPVLNEQVGTMEQLVMIGSYARHLRKDGVKMSLQLRGGNFSDRSREYDGVTFLEVDFEMTGDIKVLAAVESAPVLVGIGDTLVPAGSGREFDLLGIELDVQVREAVVQVPGHSVPDLPALGTGIGILLGQGMDIPESQERSEQQPDLRRCVHQVVTDHHLVCVGDQKDGLRQDHASYLVGDLRYRVGLEVDDVLVSPGLIDIPIAMDTQVELFSSQHQALVHR